MTDFQSYLKDDPDSGSYWYIRHGMIDRAPSLAVEITLYNTVRMTPYIKGVHFSLP